ISVTQGIGDVRRRGSAVCNRETCVGIDHSRSRWYPRPIVDENTRVLGRWRRRNASFADDGSTLENTEDGGGKRSCTRKHCASRITGQDVSSRSPGGNERGQRPAKRMQRPPMYKKPTKPETSPQLPPCRCRSW